MKKAVSLILAFSFLLSMFVGVSATASAEGTGTTYYVDADAGNDAAAGTSEATAWKTLDKVNATTFEPGDTILLKRGSIWTDSFLWPKGSGEADNPITVTSYGDESLDKPTVIARNPEGAGAPLENSVIYLENQDFVVIDGIKAINMSTGTDSMYGIRLLSKDGYRSEGCEIKNCSVSGNTDIDWKGSSEQQGLLGIYAGHYNYWGYIESVLIENNEVTNCKDSGIVVDGAYGGCNSDGSINEQSATNVVVRGNYLYNIGKDGIKMLNTNQPLVEYNVVNNSHSYADESYHVAIWAFSSYNAVFQFNEAYNTKTTYDAQGYDCDYQSYYTTFQYNYSHDNQGGFMLICTEPQNWDGGVAYNVGSVVRYNVSENDANRTFTLTGHIQDTKIYNNTIYTDAGVSEYFVYTFSRDNQTWARNTEFKNNILYLNGGGEVSWNRCRGTVFENNIIYGDMADKLPKNDSEGGDSDRVDARNNLYVDPQLADPGNAGEGIENCVAYQISEDSPAVDGGVYIEDNGGRDFFGNDISKDATPAIGAHQIDGELTAAGDVNSDLSINAKDSLLLRQYNARFDVTLDTSIADVYQDGKVNGKDSLRLRQYIAGYDVTLGE